MIWSGQTTFCILMTEKAKACFQQLDKRFQPKIFLLGILETENYDDPLSFEFDCCNEGASIMPKIQDSLKKAITSETLPTILELTQNGVGAPKKRIDPLQLKKIIEQTLNSENEFSDCFYCSSLETLNGYSIFTILSLEKNIVTEYYSLKNQPNEYFVIQTSLIDATKEQFLHDSNFFLSTKVHPVKYFLNFPNISEILRGAAFRLIGSIEFICDSEQPHFNLYPSLNKISSLKYEGSICKNEMIISKDIIERFNFQIRLKSPIQITNHKSIRKLLEIIPENCAMICDSKLIYGWGNFKGNSHPQNEDCFLVRFVKQDIWELSYNGNILMTVEREIPSLPQTEYHKQQFAHNVKQKISLENEKIDQLWDLFKSISNQKHGTTVVISNSANIEAERLKKQSFPLEPFEVTPDLMIKISSVDGAILLDNELKCHAIGVILDGLASDKCDSSRGSRYNSAIKYTEFKKDCVVIVVSEDGPVDVFPKTSD